MKNRITLILISILSVTKLFAGNSHISQEQKAKTQQQVNSWMQNSNLRFEEHKGQFKDDKGNPVAFVLFKTSSSGADLYVTTSGLSYVFYELKQEDEKEKEEKSETEKEMG